MQGDCGHGTKRSLPEEQDSEVTVVLQVVTALVALVLVLDTPFPTVCYLQMTPSFVH